MKAWFLGLLIAAGPAAAQSVDIPCAVIDYDLGTAGLATRYGEARRHGGLINGDFALEVWRNDETGSWTVMLVAPSGASCWLVSGQLWQDYGPPPPNL